jgi:hypothetical protein
MKLYTFAGIQQHQAARLTEFGAEQYPAYLGPPQISCDAAVV